MLGHTQIVVFEYQNRNFRPFFERILSFCLKALIVLALGIDSSIKQHFIDHRETCGDTESEFLFGVLPQLLEDFFKGKTCVEYFVCSAIVEYVTI